MSEKDAILYTAEPTITTLLWILATIVAAFIFLILLPSIRLIGPTEIGLPMKRLSLKKLTEDNPIAFNVDALLAMVMRGGVKGLTLAKQNISA